MKDRRLCILAVDDSNDVLDLIKLSLEATTKWRVLISSSSEEGLIQAKQEVPDLILTDFQMPKMDGVEMVEKLRSQPKTQHIPILMLTSLPSVLSTKIIKELGIRKVIKKPFDWFSLADLIVSGLEFDSQELILQCQ